MDRAEGAVVVCSALDVPTHANRAVAPATVECSDIRTAPTPGTRAHAPGDCARQGEASPGATGPTAHGCIRPRMNRQVDRRNARLRPWTNPRTSRGPVAYRAQRPRACPCCVRRAASPSCGRPRRAVNCARSPPCPRLRVHRRTSSQCQHRPEQQHPRPSRLSSASPRGSRSCPPPTKPRLPPEAPHLHRSRVRMRLSPRSPAGPRSPHLLPDA